MAKTSKLLAFDFGAESGRALLGIIEDKKLRLQEIHRFPNTPVRVFGHLHWDILRLFHEIKQGLRIALQDTGGEIDGIGIDTWGVDFGLLDENGELLANPFHYRDEHTNSIMEEVFKFVPRREVFEHTGIQFLQFNTLYQLYAIAKSGSPTLKCASTLLMMPDMFNYWLTGKKVSEFSIATTTQCYDPRAGDWAYEMLMKLDIPTHILPDIVMPGTAIGPLAQSLVSELGGGQGIEVIAPATHDTGSAVVSVPATGDNHAYISSGTWSLMGVELKQSLINDESYNKDYTNEGGIAGTFRFLRNIMGLWIVQECRRTWLNAGEDISYAELTSMAEQSQGFVSVINPDASIFLPPGDMPQRVREFCRDTNQAVPESMGEVVRCVLDSLALRYRQSIEDLDSLLNKRHDPIHIVGGGTQNKLLCQLTADATGRTVVAGPIEATAIGNVLAQALGKGFIGSLEEAREIVRNSFDLITYKPRESTAIDKAYQVFKQIA